MALATAAGVAAASAYINAKFHITKDIATLRRMKAAEKAAVTAALSKDASLWGTYEDQVKRMPDSEEFIWDRSGVWTWKQGYDAVCKYTQFLLAQGVKPKDLVAFFLTNTPEFIFLQIATWGIGSAPAMINFNLAGDALIHCLRVAGSKLVIVDEDSEVHQRIEQVRGQVENDLGMRIIVLDEALKAHILALPPVRPPNALRANISIMDPSLLIYTSGTTGHPKASPYTIARMWATTISRDANEPGLLPGPNGGRRYIPMPFYHGTGNVSACSCFLNGLTLCIGKKFRNSTFWEDIRDSRATSFVYVGEACRYLLNAPPSPRDRDHNVKSMFGNGMRPDVWTRFQERFGIDTVIEFFNSTEGVFGLVNSSRGPFFASAVGHHGLILRSLMNNKWVPVAVDPEDGSLIRDPQTGFCKREPYEIGGEILCLADSEAVFAGYKGNESATKKRFARDVFKKGDLWYRTGDSLRRDVDGRWYFNDRLGDTYRWKSENVSTAEVAAAIGNFPDIVEANVYGVLVPGADGRAGCAAVYIAPEKRSSFPFKELTAHSREKLPKYAVPVFLRLIDELAPMHNQKQNKVPLRSEGVEPDKVKAGKSPRDALFWLPPGGDAYVPFAQSDWNNLVAGTSKL